MRQQKRNRTVPVTIGYAAREDGYGVAYAGLVAAHGSPVKTPLRVEFACRPHPVLRGRDISYAALTAVAAELLRHDVRSVVLRIDDASLARDLEERAPLPETLALPYITLRCKLNAFHAARVAASKDATVRDLTARARAELALQTAA